MGFIHAAVNELYTCPVFIKGQGIKIERSFICASVGSLETHNPLEGRAPRAINIPNPQIENGNATYQFKIWTNQIFNCFIQSPIKSNQRKAIPLTWVIVPEVLRLRDVMISCVVSNWEIDNPFEVRTPVAVFILNTNVEDMSPS